MGTYSPLRVTHGKTVLAGGLLQSEAGISEVTFSGFGVASDLRLSLEPGNIGSAQIGSFLQSTMIQLRNEGGAPAHNVALAIDDAHFSIEESTCGTELAAKSNCTFNLRFTPGGVGAIRTVLRAHAEGSDATVPISATGREASILLQMPATKTIAYPSTSRISVGVQNTGAGSVSLSGLEISGPQGIEAYFQREPQYDTCGHTLAPYSECSYAVTLLPESRGYTPYANFTVMTELGVLKGQYRYSVNRTILSISPMQVDFGTLEVGDSRISEPIVVFNVGNSGKVTYDTPSNVEIVENSCTPSGASMATNTSCSMRLRYAPTTAGEFAGNLTYRVVGADYPIVLSGSAIKPTKAKVYDLNFGWTDVGYSSTQSVTITNPTAQSLGIAPLSIGGNPEFSVGKGGTCLETLAAGASCTKDITFTPTARGSRPVATLTAGELSPGTLSGMGAVGQFTMTPARIDSGPWQTGTRRTVAGTITVTNHGDPVEHAFVSNLKGPFYDTNTNCSGRFTQAVPSCTLSLYPDRVLDSTKIPMGVPYIVTYSINSEGGPVSASISLVPVYPQAALSGGTDAQAIVGASAPLILTLTNTGADTAVIDGASLVGNTTEFFLSGSTTTCLTELPKGASCQYGIKFIPADRGVRPPASLVVDIQQGEHPLSVRLEGTGQ